MIIFHFLLYMSEVHSPWNTINNDHILQESTEAKSLYWSIDRSQFKRLIIIIILLVAMGVRNPFFVKCCK